MQFPKELQLDPVREVPPLGQASMKCSSRRNCNPSTNSTRGCVMSLNEVQFPKELQRFVVRRPRRSRRRLNEVQYPKALQLDVAQQAADERHASLTCSSRKNGNKTCRAGIRDSISLN